MNDLTDLTGAGWQTSLDLKAAISLCASNNLAVPALVLTMAMIDGLAWLGRPAARDALPQAGGRHDTFDVWRSDFVAWVERYLLPYDLGDVTAEDIYAARCALVHTQIAESRMSRRAEAREIVWMHADDRVRISLGMNAPMLPTYLSIDLFVDAAFQGLNLFRAAADADPPLAALIRARAAKHLLEAHVDQD